MWTDTRYGGDTNGASVDTFLTYANPVRADLADLHQVQLIRAVDTGDRYELQIAAADEHRENHVLASADNLFTCKIVTFN
ncbi:hypothetical protein [Shewanella sp. SM73]|uniref:hypothetical protein n=1 Tax=Shewanella TaxID=22 RepID=UPI0021DB266B|nr:hypothetical protein [Shewanella sp. SM73]MCU8029736.1 hypothetical protein [Shewanella sp. SM73]